MSKNIRYLICSDHAEIEFIFETKSYKMLIDLEDFELCRTLFPKTE